MQFVDDSRVMMEDRYSIDDFFKKMILPYDAYVFFVSIMVLLLSFFMLIVSYTQKMHDLEWEQGVLRAIGLTKAQSKKLFFYEAFCIIVTSFVAGICVGLSASYLMAVSFAQLLQLPSRVYIPTSMIIYMFVVVIVATFIAVRVPSTRMNKKQVAIQIRGVNS